MTRIFHQCSIEHDNLRTAAPHICTARHVPLLLIMEHGCCDTPLTPSQRHTASLSKLYLDLLSSLIPWGSCASVPTNKRSALLSSLAASMLRNLDLMSQHSMASMMWFFATMQYDPGQVVAAAVIDRMLEVDRAVRCWYCVVVVCNAAYMSQWCACMKF